MDSVNVAARRCLREALRVVDKEGSRAGPEAAIRGAVACAGAARAPGEIRDIRARSGRDGARGLIHRAYTEPRVQHASTGFL